MFSQFPQLTHFFLFMIILYIIYLLYSLGDINGEDDFLKLFKRRHLVVGQCSRQASMVTPRLFSGLWGVLQGSSPIDINNHPKYRLAR